MSKKTLPKNLILITPGDPEGIGPEITWKVFSKCGIFYKDASLLCVGAKKPFQKLGVAIHEGLSPPGPRFKGIWLLPAPTTAPRGKHLEGFQSGWAIETATQMILDGQATALVTGPISKERLQKGGFPFPGHTEFLATLCREHSAKQTSSKSRALPVTMMLANDQLRVSLVTTHLGIHQISPQLTREKIRRSVIQTAEGLSQLWKIPKPKIAVLALNPHAGEAGLFGREEIEVISPEIASIQKEFGRAFQTSGPFPADTFFAKYFLSAKKDRYDAVVCMYHDQGLIPVKLLDFYNTVNITLGLPIIRTSVDHGVGFDIAGKGIANPASLGAAIETALQFVASKKKRTIK